MSANASLKRVFALFLLLLLATPTASLGWYVQNRHSLSCKTDLQKQVAELLHHSCRAYLKAIPNPENLEQRMILVTFIVGAVLGGAIVWNYLKNLQPLTKKLSSELADRDLEISRLKVELGIARQGAHSISVGNGATSEQKAIEARLDNPAPQAKTAANENRSKADDLTRIKGIGKVLAGKLSDIGINNFEQIAAFKPADVERVKQQISSRGLGNPSDWINQARSLMKDNQSRG
jgi:predicted flap endonuclease-1-like 5' DNA nuclease